MFGITAMANETSPGNIGEEMPDSERVMRMITGSWVSHAVTAVAHYKIADILVEAPATAELIGARANIDPDAAFRLLRACVAFGLATHSDQKFAPTSAMRLLTTTAGSLRSIALMNSLPGHRAPWARFLDAVATGKRQDEIALGADLWTHYDRNPVEAAIFDDAMAGLTAVVAEEAARLIEIPPQSMLTDVGGGTGLLLSTILRAAPHARGRLFDRPDVIDGGTEIPSTLGVADRVELVAGDFFEAVPPADIILMKHVLHNWNDEDCVRILRSVAQALPEHGRLIVIEVAMGNTEAPGPAAIFDLNVMVLFGARERRPDEYALLFEAAGLRLKSVTPTRSPYALITAAK